MYPREMAAAGLEEDVAGGMNGLRVALLAVLGFVALSLFPVGMALLSGPAAAGASAGFAEPLQHVGHLLVYVLVGLLAAQLPRTQLLVLPLAFLLMLGIGALTDISMAQLGYARVWLFAFVLLYAMAVSVAYSRVFVVCSSIASAFAYFLGARYMPTAPDIASLGYFLLGAMLCAGMMVACGLSLGVATLGYVAQLRQRIAHLQDPHTMG